jgi:putative NADH-flavin reductase
MKIAVIGATGKAGRNILQEALERGHDVTAIVRDKSKLTVSASDVIEKDIFGLTSHDLKSFDVVVNAFGAPAGKEYLHVDAGNVLIDALKHTDTRLLVVGGAGSLFVDEAKTTKVVDTPGFPKEFLSTAINQGKNLEILQNTTDLNWTFISPSAIFALGKRTGNYTLGTDQLLINAQGKSYVSYENFAVAVLDEIEQPKHQNMRFTVSSEE